jgi:hypothetical protein
MGMEHACAYCGCDVVAHDPVSVVEGTADETARRYCNYGCLVAHVEAEHLAAGATCSVDVGEI